MRSLKEMRMRVCVLLALFSLVGCGSRTPPKRYPMQGDVRGLDAQTKTATIAAGKIEGWMEAMTMDYPVKPDAEFAKLHIGDHVEATVVVDGDKYYVTGIKARAKR